MSDSASNQELSRSPFSHYLPRLRREFYQADAVVFWTLTMEGRANGWLTDAFHSVFREMALHAASREGLLCPVYTLMPDHMHFVWMGTRLECDQRNGMKFFRAQLGKKLKPLRFQHQAHDRVLSEEERKRDAFSKTCSYVLANPVRAGLVRNTGEWRYSGSVVPGYPDISPSELDFWPWFWRHYLQVRDVGVQQRSLPRREME